MSGCSKEMRKRNPELAKKFESKFGEDIFDRAPRPPEDWSDTKVVDGWKKEYEKWRKDNDHVKNIPPVEQTMERIKKQQEMMAQRPAQGGAPSGASPEIRRIESKLDALINHLGVKWPTTAATKPPVPLQNQAAPVSNQKSQRTGKQPKKS